MKVKNLILGAGISGLACANKIINGGEEAVVFEAQNYFGGGCHSFEVNGFCFDSAVHLSFASDKAARAFFDRTPYQTHLPIAYNYYNSLWMKHPILNNMYPLDVDEKVECIKAFVDRKAETEVSNYSQWLKASYGDVIAEKFYDVYTRKYWTVDPEELSISWVGPRLSSADLGKVLRGAFTDDTGLDYYVKEMRYPLGKGGYETFLNPLMEGVDVIFNKRCVEVDLANKYVRFQDGLLCYYENLFSSIPLPELAKCLVHVPMEIKELAFKLKASKVSLVSIGFQKPDIAKWLWFYIYDEDIMAARVNSPSIKCKDNAPEGCSSLQFEIYHNPDEQIDEDTIINNTRYALRKMNLCDDKDILFMDYRLLQYGNVIFYKGMESIRDQIKKYLTGYGVRLMGRFGEWDYLWSDQSYLSGCRAAKI